MSQAQAAAAAEAERRRLAAAMHAAAEEQAAAAAAAPKQQKSKFSLFGIGKSDESKDAAAKDAGGEKKGFFSGMFGRK